MTTTRVLIADAVPAYLLGLRLSLSQAGFNVVGEASAADDVPAMFVALQATVLVLDLHLGTTSDDIGRHAEPSFAIAKQVLEQTPAAQVIFHGEAWSNDDLVHTAYQLGAAAFVTKQSALATMVDMVLRVSENNTPKPYFLPEIAHRLAVRATSRGTSPKSLLTGRDLEVFRYMAHGWSTLEIACKMDLSTKTISITSQRVKDALGVHRPAQLTLLAIKHGLISVTQPWPSPLDAQAGLAIGSDGGHLGV